MSDIAASNCALPPNDHPAQPGLDQVMSKTKLKKLQKYKRFQEKVAERKADAKQRKKEENERRHNELSAKLSLMTNDDREAWKAQRQAVRQERKDQNQNRKSRLQQAQAGGQTIIIDLGFDELMTEPEIKSLAQQLVYCYSVNSKANEPGQLVLTDFTGVIVDQLTVRSPGHTQWIIAKHEASYIDVYRDRKDVLVYLTADADDELQQLDSNNAYIIGGIVDRNRHKNICRDKAVEQGIKTARLPIRQHLQMTGTHVLTVNQVLALLLEVLQCHDWQQALLKVIPGRKQACTSQLEAAPDASLPAQPKQVHEDTADVDDRLADIVTVMDGCGAAATDAEQCRPIVKDGESSRDDEPLSKKAKT